MTFTIEFNHITYLVTDHAARRMVQRDVTNEMIIDTMEQGDWREQPNGRDLYERDVFIGGKVILLQVVADHSAREIVTVIIKAYD